jgi:GTP-sensing pleiotropic transcriptional regulator CodY
MDSGEIVSAIAEHGKRLGTMVLVRAGAHFMKEDSNLGFPVAT